MAENQKFKLVYDKAGTITGSYSGIPSDDDVAVIEVAVLEGEEEPTPVPVGTVNITENGTYNIAEYASADVDIPNPSIGTLEITENGVYDVTNKASVDVDVQGGGPTPTGNINITTTAQTDVAAYATAQVVDTNLVAGNIRNGVTILGVSGTFDNHSADLDALLQETF